MRVVVVGAGLGGLSAAAHLVGQGHEVSIIERDSSPGGRAGLFAAQGYRIDTGPAVLTMPDLLASVFAAAGREMSDFVTLRPVDPMYRAVFSDGSQIRVWHGEDRMAQEIEEVCGPGEAAAYRRFCAWLTELYRVEMPHFIDANTDSLLGLARPLGPILRLARLGGFRRLGPTVQRAFRDERLQRLFSFQALYAGLAPHEALALYAVITYMDTVGGVFFPDGGMHAVATGLAAAVEKAGGSIRYDAPVTRILRHRGTTGAVAGVELDGGERISADAVVCNPDLPVAYRALLGIDAPRVARRGRYSPSCALWLAGVRGLPPDGTAQHNIHFGRDWDGAFRALMRDGSLMPDPSTLISLHSLGSPDLAPAGCSTLYALEPVPNLDGSIDWPHERDRIAADLRRRVADLGYPVEVEVERFVDPLDWEASGLERGTPFALAHTFRQTGPFRPRNIDHRVPGLVFVGSSTVPGVGVPMVLVSGRLAAERVQRWAAEGRP
jgi:phytoene desaturase